MIVGSLLNYGTRRKMQSLPEPPTESSNDELNTELAELSLRANAALVGLGAVPDSRPLPDRVRDAVGEFSIALGSQKSVVTPTNQPA